MDEQERRARWQRCYAESAADLPEACSVLRDHLHLLPPEGDALDLASGRGGNALLLARQGLRVQAWDYADSALEALESQAQAAGLSVHTQCRDVVQQPPTPGSFDVIVVSNFLDRSLFPALVDALRPGGLLFYETWLGERQGRGPQDPVFRLAPGELPQLIQPLQAIHYQESGDRAGLLARS